MILGINLVLFITKISFAVISGSKSLLADGFQSLANLITTVVVLVGLKLAAREADDRFPYGYGKAEFLASGIINTVLMLAAIAFIAVSFREMVKFAPYGPPRLIAIAGAVISIILNHAAFSYGRCAGEKLGSPSILANAWVSRADVGTSIAVIVAVIGANMGFAKLDHIAAILIAALVIKVTADGLREALKGLMDTSLFSETSRMRNVVEDVEGVTMVEALEARLAGREILVDLEVGVPGDLTLGKGMKLKQNITTALHAAVNNISEVAIRLIPCRNT